MEVKPLRDATEWKKQALVDRAAFRATQNCCGNSRLLEFLKKKVLKHLALGGHWHVEN